MTNSLLEPAIQRYEKALTDLQTLAQKLAKVEHESAKSESKLSELQLLSSLVDDALLEVLIDRDEVQALLLREKPDCGTQLKHLSTLDNQLENLEIRAVLTAKQEHLEQWRKTLKPPLKAWWWFPAVVPYAQDRHDWLWNGLSILFFTISLGLFTNIATRFFVGGPDAFGAIAISMQSVLTLLGVRGSLTPVWQEVIEKWLEKRGLPKHWQQEVRCGIAFGILAILFGCYASLPLVSNGYLWWGRQNSASGRITSAQDKFNRAILLNPENAYAHYSLGRLYESIQMDDRARTELQIAAQGGISRAYIDLARLEILNRKYSVAVSLLANGLQRLDADAPTQKVKKELDYALFKNLGWARLEQGRYEEAQTWLEQAIKLDNKKSVAHCLLAQTFEHRKNKAKARQSWNWCYQLVNQEIERALPIPPQPVEALARFPIDEDKWLAQAKKCLKPEYSKQQCLKK
jgi:tetratricopeptide (TPR) repeat protein